MTCAAFSVSVMFWSNCCASLNSVFVVVGEGAGAEVVVELAEAASVVGGAVVVGPPAWAQPESSIPRTTKISPMMFRRGLIAAEDTAP
jgi:predicted alpha/beta hydrolase family esterase